MIILQFEILSCIILFRIDLYLPPLMTFGELLTNNLNFLYIPYKSKDLFTLSLKRFLDIERI